jgi:2-phosphosulfolactate phosphatase
LNRAAVVRAALAAAGTEGAIAVVCSGNQLGTQFSLEDTVVAGALVDEICRLLDDSVLERTDTATAARRLWHTYGAAPRRAFEDSVHGKLLLDLGFDADLDLCARLDRYAVAPRLQVTVDGRLLLRDAAAEGAAAPQFTRFATPSQ